MPNSISPGLGGAFARFWTGSLSSNLADGVMFTALPMAAAMLTEDPLLVSGLAVARFLPWLLTGLVAGVVVDRRDRVRLMAAANTVRGGALALLAVLVATDQATIRWLYAVMFAVMLCEVFYDLSGRAMLPDVVPSGTLDRANGRLEGGKLVTEQFAGAALAGFLFALAAALPLVVNAGAYLLGALVLLGLPPAVRRPPEAGRPTSGGAVRSVSSELKDGVRAVFGRRELGATALLLALVNAALAAQASILVLLVQDRFGVPEALYGLFLSAAAAGGLLGAVSTGGLVRLLGRFATGTLAFGALGVLSAAFALSPNAVTAAVAWSSLAFAASVVNVVASGVWQLVIPGSLLGRALSCITTVGQGAAPLGAVAGGLLGRVDLRLPSVAAGAAVVLGGALAAPALRTLCRSADAAECEAVSGDREGSPRREPEEPDAAAG